MVKIQILGRQIIKVTHVSVKEFEANPSMIWNYDVMMHGTWDANAGNVLNDNAINEIAKYIDAGKGVLAGHDTVGFSMGNTLGLSKIADKFNIKRGISGNVTQNGYDINKSWGYLSDKVKISKKGFLTQFPWSLGPVRNNINSTNNTYNIKWC